MACVIYPLAEAVAAEEAVLKGSVGGKDTELEGEAMELGGLNQRPPFGGGLEEKLQGGAVGAAEAGPRGGEEGETIAGARRGGVGEQGVVEEEGGVRRRVAGEETGVDLLELAGGGRGRPQQAEDGDGGAA